MRVFAGQAGFLTERRELISREPCESGAHSADSILARSPSPTGASLCRGSARGKPDGPERERWCLREWCRLGSTATVYVYDEPGSPWEAPWVESFNGRVRDELLTSTSSAPSPRPRSSSRRGGWSPTPTGRDRPSAGSPPPSTPLSGHPAPTSALIAGGPPSEVTSLGYGPHLTWPQGPPSTFVGELRTKENTR